MDELMEAEEQPPAFWLRVCCSFFLRHLSLLPNVSWIFTKLTPRVGLPPRTSLAGTRESGASFTTPRVHHHGWRCSTLSGQRGRCCYLFL